jgi:hypothetical protein
MGTRRDGRIDAGQPLGKAISARAWNRAQDAADIVLGQAPGATAGPTTAYSPPYEYVYCRNTSPRLVPRFGVLEIDGLEITPGGESDDGTSQFVEMPVVTGVVPGNSIRWGVALEPIAPDKIGRLAVAGVVQARVNVISTGHQFVRLKDQDETQLITDGQGQGLILWAEEEVGESRWALIRIVGGSSAGLRMVTFTGAWNKGTFREITAGGTDVIDVRNSLATIDAGCGEARKGVIAQIEGVWELIAAECA